ncbi:hypothetical protein K2173_024683 [Erythroxylum novogranatense]|uniref:GTP diphosphokinase n=1 Tax=Erythroxylum novogranatense TaxID=1862640 RepID=A0AAV8SVU9_9ROSI|nr:hypothetical protein K2173_024683 [Erythroxylum novogranatense]
MQVPTIALYASPPGSVCSTAHACQINAHATFDFDLNSRSSSTGSSGASCCQKPSAGGLSCLFSSPTVKHASFSGDREELGSLWHDRGEDVKELSGSYWYSSSKFLCGSFSKREQSPVSVFQGPVSCSTSPPMRIGRERCVSDVGFQSSIHGSSFRGGANLLFNGIVTSALESCVDYDSPSSEIEGVGGDVAVVADELTFSMEDTCVEVVFEPYAKKLLSDAQLRHKIFHEDVIIQAFYEAEKAHRGQMRASGDPYLQHCVETAVLLAEIGATSTVVAAGLLHDTLDDSFLSHDYIRRSFGADVADLVEGVSKLSHLSKLARENNTANRTVEADRLHTIFLAMTDARAVLIKLADRLHNMITLDALSLIKQQRVAKETLEIFVPLACRLGISTWKEKLENLCFKHLNPDQHKELYSKLVECFDEAAVTAAKEKLVQALENEGILYHVLCGRHKSLYSIYSKMLKKKLNMDEIHDIHGLRLIVQNEDECYKAMRIVCHIWPEVPGKFKDYIRDPKPNGYKSLHMVVMGEGTMPLEVQIRTKEMHLQAEFGFAAHWRYKEGDREHPSSVLQMVEWARWVLSWQCETMSKPMKPPCTFPSHSDDCPFSFKPLQSSDGPIFIIVIENDKMSVQEFPANSTFMDLLERAKHENLRGYPYGYPWKQALRPKLNHEAVNDPTCKLKMGDVVELTPTIPVKSLTEYREEIQRMYNKGSKSVSNTGAAATSGGGVVGGRV